MEKVKAVFKRMNESGWFMFCLSLLCVLFGVADGAVFAADAIAPPGGGSVELGDGITATETRERSENLLLDTIDEKVAKIRPYDVILDTISRQIKDVRTSNNQVVRHYAIDTIDLSTTLKTATTADQTQVALDTNNNDIFASEQTIIAVGVKGYKPDGSTEDPDHDLMLYVVGKDSSEKPLVITYNGKGASRNKIPAIPQDTVLTRAGRAGSETQIQTDPYSGVPTDFEQYLQKFMAQVELSEIFQRADKEVDWEFTDAEEEAIFDMKRVQNVTYWKGVRGRVKTKNAHTNKAEDVYFTEGIWTQGGKEFSFEGQDPDEKSLVTLMKHAFTGNASGKTKLIICGSDLLEKLEQVEYQKIIYVGKKKQAYGIEFNEIISKFGTLMAVHDQSLDDIGMADKGFILDPNFLRKWTMGWRVNDFDFRKSGQADSDGRGLMEICGLVLKNPNAHSRVSLSAFE